MTLLLLFNIHDDWFGFCCCFNLLRLFESTQLKEGKIWISPQTLNLFCWWEIGWFFSYFVVASFQRLSLGEWMFALSLNLFVQVISYVAYIIHFCSLVWKQIHSLCDVNIFTRSSEQRNRFFCLLFSTISSLTSEHYSAHPNGLLLRIKRGETKWCNLMKA